MEWNYNFGASRMTVINKMLIYFKLLLRHSSLFVIRLKNVYVGSRERSYAIFTILIFNEGRSKKV